MTPPAAPPAITVFIPAYNCAPYIGEAIDSILGQSFTDFELLIIDDGSTDGTCEVIERCTDPRLRLLRNPENRGAAFTANRGFAEARGRYLARADADDIQAPDRLLLQWRLMESEPDLAVCSSYLQAFGVLDGLLRYPENPEDIKCRLLFFCTLNQTTVTFRMEFIRAHGLRYNEQLRVAEDYDLWFRITHRYGGKIRNMPKPLALYRIHKQSLTFSQEGNLMRASDSFVRVPYLEALGVPVTPEHLALHDALYHGSLAPGPGAVEKAASWLRLLWEGNLRQQVYDPAVWGKVLAKQLLAVVQANLVQGPQVCGHLFAFPGFSFLAFSPRAQAELMQEARRAADEARTLSLTSPVPWNGTEPLRVLFLGERAALWPCLHSVWQAMCSDARFAPTVVPLRCVFSGSPEYPAPYFERRGIPFVPPEAYDLEQECPHLVFSCMPSEFARPAAFSLERMSRLGARVGYIHYGFEVGGGPRIREYQYGQPLHRHAWRVFARSEAHAKAIAHYTKRLARDIVPTGHPKIDAILQAGGADIPQAWRVKAAGRPCVLWNVHFAVPAPGVTVGVWSSWHMIGEALVRHMYERSDMVLLLRFHPQFFAFHREHGLLDAAGEDALRALVAGCPNIIVDEEGDYLPAFAFSQGLLSDSSSLLLEYAPLQKPICHVQTPESAALEPAVEALLQQYYRAKSLAQVKVFLGMAAQGRDPLRAKRHEAASALLGPLDGRCGERIAAYVLKAIGKE